MAFVVEKATCQVCPKELVQIQRNMNDKQIMFFCIYDMNYVHVYVCIYTFHLSFFLSFILL